jgi:hypothetical protein
MDNRPATAATSAFVRFPPKWQNVLVPTRPASATALGMTLYTASRPLPVFAQQVLWWAAVGSRGLLLPGRRERWSPPLPEETFQRLCAAWAAATGRVPDAVAVYHRLQAERRGITLLLCAGRRSMLVRVRADETTLTREREISTAAATTGPTAFRVPQLRGAGEVDGWSWVGYELIAERPHRPVRRPVPGLTDQISELVESVVPRPEGNATHWRGAHRDLTPWNLRRSHTGTWLIDWEDAGWAPPGADEVYFRATVAAMGRRPVRALAVPDEQREAARYWLDIVRARPIATSETTLKNRLETLLDVG